VEVGGLVADRLCAAGGAPEKLNGNVNVMLGIFRTDETSMPPPLINKTGVPVARLLPLPKQYIHTYTDCTYD
jgi:hypothetical protein